MLSCSPAHAARRSEATLYGRRLSSAPTCRRYERTCSRVSVIWRPVTDALVLRGLLQFADDASDGFLRVAEQHAGLRIEIEIVVDAGEARLHRPLDDDDVLRLIDVEDGHAVDRARLVGACRGIRHVVRGDDQR